MGNLEYPITNLTHKKNIANGILQNMNNEQHEEVQQHETTAPFTSMSSLITSFEPMRKVRENDPFSNINDWASNDDNWKGRPVHEKRTKLSYRESSISYFTPKSPVTSIAQSESKVSSERPQHTSPTPFWIPNFIRNAENPIIQQVFYAAQWAHHVFVGLTYPFLPLPLYHP